MSLLDEFAEIGTIEAQVFLLAEHCANDTWHAQFGKNVALKPTYLLVLPSGYVKAESESEKLRVVYSSMARILRKQPEYRDAGLIELQLQ